MAEPDKPSPPAAPAKTQKPKPAFRIYSRQKDQHVVGPGCWCLPKVEIVNGKQIVVHKRD